MSYQDYCIFKNQSIREAMKRLDKTKPQILFIVDGKNLLASLTDGDIRRFLLNGGQLDDIVLLAGNCNPKVATNVLKAKGLYNTEDFVAIPIINDNGELEEVYFGNNRDKLNLANLDLPVVINAGGKGTRLEPYTKILPKPLIPVGEIPIIEHIMQQFGQYACNKFHIIVNYKKELMKAYFVENDDKYDICWYDETKPLGTGGGLCYLKGKVDTTFFFTNCDNLLLSNYDSIVRFHKSNNNAVTMVCAYKNFTIPYGVINMGINGSIESMQEKPEYSFLTNTGIYVVEPEVLEEIDFEEAIGFPDVITKIQEKGMKVAVYPVSEYEWLDMGQMTELEKMRERLERM